jgi:lipopolysaccharide export system permease protein
MIIYRALSGETLRNTAAITVILAVIIGFLGITVLLGRAVRGEIAEDIVMRVLGLQTLKRMDLLLTLGLYLGALLTVSRWYRDSEMTVLGACGISLTQLVRPLLVITAVVAVAIAGFSLYFNPWASSLMERLKIEREQQRQPVSVAPGVFNEASGGTRIFYAEHVNRDGIMGNVFISSVEDGKQTVVIAHSGYPHIDERTSDNFLVLLDGTLYEGIPGEAGYRLASFKIFHMRLEPKFVPAQPARTDEIPSVDLYRRSDPTARAEWQWRISKPIMAMVLVIFALVLAYTEPRRGRLGNIFMAIIVYFVYSNLIALGQTLIKKGHVPGALGLWWVHALMLILALHFLRQRSGNKPLLALPALRRRRR